MSKEVIDTVGVETTPKTIPAPAPVVVAKPGIVARFKDFSRNKKTATGLGTGAALLLVLGAPILAPVAAAGGAYYFYRKDCKGYLTPERKKVLEDALKSKDSAHMRVIADAFQKAGCDRESKLLLKRAALQDLPHDVKEQRREVFKETIRSSNVHGIEKVASAFEGEGCTGAAQALRVRAEALKNM